MDDLLSDDNTIVEDSEIRKKVEKEIEELRNFIWEEKYRPRILDDVILPDSIKNPIKYALDEDSLQNMIFYSSKPGTGKTTVAKVIPEMHGCEYLFLKGAECNLATVEHEISNYGYRKLGDNKPRFVILDEVDKIKTINREPFYGSLQPTIEATRATLRFILTTNNLHLIPEAIRSRCRPIDFNHNDDSVKKPMWDRLKYIAEIETKRANGTVNLDTLRQIASNNFPDMRAIISVMQHNFNTNQGSIKGDVSVINLDHISEVWKLINKGDIVSVRKYYTEHITDINGMFVPLEKHAFDNCKKEHRLSLAVVIAEHQWRSAYDQVDPEINMNAMIAKIIKIVN